MIDKMDKQGENINILNLYSNAEKLIKGTENESLMPSVLWHYTSIKGFEGIIKGKSSMSFWFTRSDCLNDNSEGIHIIKIYQKVLHKLRDENHISEEVYSILKNINPVDKKYVPYPIPKDEDGISGTMIDIQDCDAYICCFSTNSDSLDMWRYYAETKNGYAIGVYKELFEKFFNYPFSACEDNQEFAKLEAFNVIYDTKTKEDLMEQLIKNACAIFENYCLDDKEKRLTGYIEYVLTNLRYRFKHDCFSSEKEYRFVFFRPRKKPKNLAHNLPKIECREQNGIMIPYIILNVPKTWLWEIKLSPFIKETNAIELTESYLESKGCSNITVTHSELPVR